MFRRLTLRQRVLFATGAMMAILLMLVTTSMIADALEARRARTESETRLLVATFDLLTRDFAAEQAAARGDPQRLLAAKARLTERAAGIPGQAGWSIHDETVRLVAGTAADGHLTIVRPVEVAPGRTWTLRIRRSAAPARPFGGMTGLFAAFLVGGIVLIGVLYLLLDRLILRPVDRLVSASRNLAEHGVPAPVAGGERKDELGELIRAFNAMGQEVFEYRSELETKVREATEEYERTQQRLVLADRLSATGRFAAGIAHEINNPLGGLINAARTIEKDAAPGSRPAAYARLILDGLGRIQRTVKDLLTFARAAPDVRAVALGEIVDTALGFSRHRVEKEGIEVATDVPADLPPVAGDANLLAQVFLNLVVNALDAMDAMDGAAEKKLSIEAHAAETDEGREIVCAVRDSGAGMDEATRKQAFDLFFTTKDPEQGTGLGLPICHNIVAGHGGSMEIDSEPGAGTTVRVRLPLERAPREPAPPRREALP